MEKEDAIIIGKARALVALSEKKTNEEIYRAFAGELPADTAGEEIISAFYYLLVQVKYQGVGFLDYLLAKYPDEEALIARYKVSILLMNNTNESTNQAFELIETCKQKFGNNQAILLLELNYLIESNIAKNYDRIKTVLTEIDQMKAGEQGGAV